MIKKLPLIKVFTFSVFAILLNSKDIIAQNIALDWVHSLEGNIDQPNRLLSRDVIGNIFTIGNFGGAVDCDPSLENNILVCNDTSTIKNDFFVTKFDNNGNFLWAKQIGGINSECVETITTDQSNNLYLLGSFYEVTDFDPSEQTYELNAMGIKNTFILKLDWNGNFVWVKNLIASNIDLQKSIIIDSNNNIIIAGNFNDTLDLDPSANIFELISTGNSDIFILKLNSYGDFIWANKLGGTLNEEVTSIAIDDNNNIYSTGGFHGVADFNPKYGVNNLTAIVGGDIFISKLDENGNFNWAKSMGGIQEDISSAITIDLFQNVITTGKFTGTIDFDTGESGFNLTGTGNPFSNMFIHKLNQEGEFIWAKKIDAKIGSSMISLISDDSGNIYTTGSFRQIGDFDPSGSIYNLTGSGAGEIFLSKLDASGNFLSAHQFGYDIGSGIGKSILLDNQNNLFIYGSYNGTVEFDPNEEIFNLTSTELSSTFLLKLSQPETVSLTENSAKTIINTYPNPTNGIFSIDLKEKSEITVTNTLGETVLQQNFVAGIQNINLYSQVNGIYFVRVLSRSKIGVAKIIKE
jgi:Secretion system C-terminal sorting domain